MKKKRTICGLCEEQKPLIESHIIPKSIYKWLKRSISNGSLRHAFAPDKKVQDGHKLHLLCQDCETKISVWERLFKIKVFDGLANLKNSRIEYGPWLLKFCTSISLRVALFLMEKEGNESLSSEQLKHVESAINRWRSYILDKDANPSRYEQHILPFGLVEQPVNIRLPQSLNSYLHMTIDMAIYFDRDEMLVYSKLGPIVIVGHICVKKRRDWMTTKVHLLKGALSSQKYNITDSMLKKICSRALACAKMNNGLSEIQQEQVSSTIERHLIDYPDSPAALAIKMDERIVAKEKIDFTSKLTRSK